MPTVRQRRGPIVEALHPFSAVVVQDAAVRERFGPDVTTTYRSSAKPFQLAVSLEALGDPQVSDEELAVGAASHSAEPTHLTLVAGLLERFGLDETALRCGAHAPMHVASAEAILRAGGHFTNLHNNCSGKHTFMRAACDAMGWAPDYRDSEHPLQRRVADAIADAHGTRGELAVDGCGVPTFGLPLSAIARGWTRIAEAMRAHDSRLGRIGLAMARHPELTSGTGRLDLDVVRHVRETVAVKIGAQGLFCLAFPERGLGVAVKVHSGSGDALPAATSAVLSQVIGDTWREPEGWALRDVRNVVGRSVGAWDVSLDD